MSRGHETDGQLASWDDVKDACKWSALLLGNGLSRQAWDGFGYGSLFIEAQRGGEHGQLTPADLRLFTALETENFERVLGELSIAIRMAAALSLDATPYYERYASIKAALVAAIRNVHISLTTMDKDVLDRIKDVLRRQQLVFTTSYDLVLYWAMGRQNYKGFKDCFWSQGTYFDPGNCDVWASDTPVYYLHGALHLLAEGSGRTRKLTLNSQTLLEQFGQPDPRDPTARPLVITEGSSQEKLRAIEDNVYLSHALNQLRECHHPLVVFGSQLSDQDAHLVGVLNEEPERPIAVSIRPGEERVIRARQGELRHRLSSDSLMFFDATTHPLVAGSA